MVAMIQEFENQIEEMEKDLRNWKQQYLHKLVFENFLCNIYVTKELNLNEEQMKGFIKFLEKTTIKEHTYFNKLKKYNILKRSEALEICQDMDIYY